MREFSLLVIIILASCATTKDLDSITNNSTVLTSQGAVKIDASPKNFGFGVCEPSICIDPTNKDMVLAASVLDNIYTSTDGGLNWSKKRLQSSMGVYGDPVVRIDFDGEMYFAHLSNPDGLAYQSESFLDRIVVQKSGDKGASWNDGTHPAIRGKADQDKQWMAIDPRDNAVYMTWTEFDTYGSDDPNDKSRILFSKSTDKLETWSSPIAINQFEGDCIDSDFTTEGAVPAIGPEGELYVTWAFNNKLYFDMSNDQGLTWMDEDLVIAEQVEGWDLSIPGLGRANGFPITEVDLSDGPYRGDIYVNWSDQRNGINDTDIWIMKSSDHGKTWTDAMRVNDDAAGKHQFFSWMDVDPVTGYIYIVFYDRRDHDDIMTDVYVAYSTDGAKTFINQKVSEVPFTPDPTVFFGDYNDISAYDNRIMPIWTQIDDKEFSIWTAVLDME